MSESDVANNAANQMHSNHPPSLFGMYTEVKPSVVVAAFAILEATVFFGLYLFDPELGSMLCWGSIAVATFRL
jgi:hypothetical protein